MKALKLTPNLVVRDVVTIDGVRAIFDDGWGLIRASNTQPALVLRFEATSPERLATIRALRAAWKNSLASAAPGAEGPLSTTTRLSAPTTAPSSTIDPMPTRHPLPIFAPCRSCSAAPKAR